MRAFPSGTASAACRGEGEPIRLARSMYARPFARSVKERHGVRRLAHDARLLFLSAALFLRYRRAWPRIFLPSINLTSSCLFSALLLPAVWFPPTRLAAGGPDGAVDESPI